jgi:hypothetical protein
VVLVVLVTLPGLNITVPTASWTLCGGGGITPGALMIGIVDVEVDVVPLTPAPAEGAALVPTTPPALETAPGEALFAPDTPVPVLVVLPVVVLVVPVGEQAGFVATAAPVEGEAAAMADGLAETDETGDAAVLAAVLAGALAPVTGPVLAPVLGPAVPPHAPSTSATAASVGMSAF